MAVIFWILLAILYFKFGYRLIPSAKIAIGVILSLIIIAFLWFTIEFIGLIILIILLGIGAYIFHIIEDKKQDEEIATWKNQKFQHFDSYTFSNIIEYNCNSDFIRYKGGDIPYNRMLYFASGSKEHNDSDRVFPIYYHAFCSKKSVNLEEHGFLVTTAEIIIKKYKPALKQDGNNTKKMVNASMMTITTVVTVGPDLVRALRGGISWGQLVKNTVVTGAGMAAGMALGSFVPVVGTIAGGAVGGFVAKCVADYIREDDAVEMIQIAKEEFIDTILMSGLTKEEFKDALNKTFLHKNFNVFLQKMYSTGDDARKFVRKTYKNLIGEYYNSCELPTEQEIIDVVTTELILSE